MGKITDEVTMDDKRRAGHRQKVSRNRKKG